ncbi:MAG: hypothetical protein LBE51_19610 [Acidovorax sp.]|jgi:hypothetical protein|nr:hypothetical protein [Acidovorax sp.]
MSKQVKYMPNNLRMGGTPLFHGQDTGIAAEPDSVHRVNEQCVELNAYLNLTHSGVTGYIGMSIIITLCALIPYILNIGFDNLDFEIIVDLLIVAPVLTFIAFFFYFLSGAHRCRGTYIRINRITRKLYFIYPNDLDRLHVLDWGQIEAVAGYIPIVSPSGYASRHPLYLFGIDHAMDPPTEICAACGNVGVADGDRSARALWAYLQAFMAHGPQGLPSPPAVPPRRSRREETLAPYREWYAGLHRRLTKPGGWLWAPITIPLWIGWLLINAFPDSVEAWLQYNVPYATFPKEIDVLCGFAEKRKPVIRVNGERIDS